MLERKRTERNPFWLETFY